MVKSDRCSSNSSCSKGTAAVVAMGVVIEVIVLLVLHFISILN